MKKVIDIEDKLEKEVEKTRKQSKLSLKAIRQLETLSHYFKIDDKNRIVTICLHYSKASEIVDSTLGNKNHPYIRNEILEKISDIMHSIPIEFLIDVDIKIDDYEGYNASTLISSIKDTFEIFHYDVSKERTTSNLKVALLIVLGVTILAWLYYLCSKKFIGQAGDPTHDTVHELIYTVGAVVLWEAVYIIFLPEREYNNISHYILKRTNRVKLLDKNDNILMSTTKFNMSVSWMIESKKERRARYFLLLSGTTLICLSAIKIRDIAEVILTYKASATTFIIVPIQILIVIFGFLAGIGATSYYRDKGPFKKFVLFFGVIASITYIAEIISTTTLFALYKTYYIKPIFALVAYFVVMLIYTLCAFMLRNRGKKKK